MPASKAIDAALEKIRSEYLRREATQTHAKPHVVILEVDLPQPKIKVSRAASGIDAKRLRVVSADSPDSSKIEERVAETRRSIEKILGKPPDQFFSSSGAFVVTATGEQLRKLARLPSVSAIWPNDRREATA